MAKGTRRRRTRDFELAAHEDRALTATRTARLRPEASPPFPVVACWRRTLSPVVTQTWATCSTVAMVMEITLQYFEDCPNWQVAEDRLRQVLAELGRPEQEIRRQRVETPEEAARVDFGGSPTILVDGIDPFADPAGPAGYACRMYDSDAAPTVTQLRAALAG